MNCPKCNTRMEMLEADPDVGVFTSEWYCYACDIGVPAADNDDEPEVLLMIDRPKPAPLKWTATPNGDGTWTVTPDNPDTRADFNATMARLYGGSAEIERAEWV